MTPTLKHATAFVTATCALVIAVSSTSEAAILQWGTGYGSLYEQDGATLLPGDNQGPPPVTPFIQLLHIGTDGVYDAPEKLTPGTNGDGTFGDDVVIAQSWAGDGGVDGFENGMFSASPSRQPDASDFTSGVDDFAIRVFDTAVSEDDWYEGNIPTTGYHNYVIFENPEKTAGDYQLAIDSDLWTTKSVSPIPEPSTVLLFMAGLVAVIARRRRV